MGNAHSREDRWLFQFLANGIYSIIWTQPSLLDRDDLVKVSSAELLRFVEYVPDDDRALIDRILPRLLAVDDTDLANEMIRRLQPLLQQSNHS